MFKPRGKDCFPLGGTLAKEGEEKNEIKRSYFLNIFFV
jgi:hypothetical protein